MLEDMLRPGLSDEEHLSNLCTLLVIAEGMDMFPIETIAEFLAAAVQRINECSSGDKAVLVVRAASLLLEKFPRRLGSVHGTITPLLTAVMAWCRLLRVETKETGGCAAADGNESAPAPPAPLGQQQAAGEGKRGKGRGSGGKRPGHAAGGTGASRSGVAVAPSCSRPLLFESSSAAELGEELLRCMQLLHGNDRLRHTLPSPDQRLAVCKAILTSAAPLSPASRNPLSYVAKLVRSGGLSEHLLQECAEMSTTLMEYLAEHCDFTPHWDESLCCVTYLMVTLVRHHSTPAPVKSAVTSSCLKLARKAWAKRPATRRWNLIVACVATSIGPSATVEELTRDENWEWIRAVIEEGVNCSVARRIGNPFCSSEVNGGFGASGSASRRTASNEDDDELTIPNTQWIPEDAKITCLWLLCRALHPALTDAVVQFRYLVAWRDDHEQFRRYSTLVGRSIVNGFYNSLQSRMSLPAVSGHHSVLFGPLTQLNEYTGVQRTIFLQPVPTTGTVVKPSSEGDLFAMVPRASTVSVGCCSQLRQLLPTLMRLWSSPDELGTIGLATAALSFTLMKLIVTSHFVDCDEADYVLPVLDHIGESYLSFPLAEVDAFVTNLLSEPAASAKWGRVLAKSKVFSRLQLLAEADEGGRTTTNDGCGTAEPPAPGKRSRSGRGDGKAKKTRRTASSVAPGAAPPHHHTTTTTQDDGNPIPEPSARSILQRIQDCCRVADESLSTDAASAAWLGVKGAMPTAAGGDGEVDGGRTAAMLLDPPRPSPVADIIGHIADWVSTTPDAPRSGQSLSQFVNRHQHALSEESLAALHSAIESKLRLLVPKEKKALTFGMCARTTKVNICQRSRGPTVCPKVPSHGPLRLHHSASWICNECGRRSSFASLSCRECDYDLCQHCALVQNPLSIDVSDCATVGDIVKYLTSSGPTFGGASTGPSGELFLGGTWFTMVREFCHSRAGPNLAHLRHPVLSCTTTPTAVLSFATTVHSLPLGSRKRRNDMFGLHTAASGTTHHHHTHLPVELHLLSDESPQHCACHHVARQSPLLAPAHPTPDLLPVDSTAPHRNPSRKDSFTALQEAYSQLPEHMSTPVALKSISRTSPPRRAAGSLALLSEVEAIELVVPPCEGIGRVVVEIAESSAVDIFFSGLLGLPAELRALLQSRQRACVPVAVRKDLMRFCAAECRRHALAHMVAAGFRTRGTVSVDLRSAPVCTKCVTKRGDLSRIVSDLDRVFSTQPTLRSKVEFALEGEEGTGEGPTQEVYAEVSHLVAAETQLWFRLDGDDDASADVRVLFPCRQASSPLDPSVFRVLGACFARSLVDGFTMDLSLSPTLWECVVAARTASESDLLHFVASRLDPLLHKNVVSLLQLDGSELADMELFIDNPTMTSSPAAVGLDNVSLYVERTLRRRFSDCCTSVRSFLAGFSSVADPGVLSMIAPDEADVVFCGRRADGTDGHLFTEAELRAHTVGAHGYSLDSAEVQNLLRIAASLSPMQQSHFIEFLTGTPRLPLGGLAGLNRPITVARKDLDYGDQTLPSCNTCFLYFKLPPYRSAELMRERLLVAITEGRKNFSLS